MLAELRKKSQITIPKDIINKIGLEEGDQLEIVEKNGIIELIPVAIYPKNYIESLHTQIDELKHLIETNEIATYSSIDDLMNSLEEE